MINPPEVSVADMMSIAAGALVRRLEPDRMRETEVEMVTSPEG